MPVHQCTKAYILHVSVYLYGYLMTLSSISDHSMLNYRIINEQIKKAVPACRHNLMLGTWSTSQKELGKVVLCKLMVSSFKFANEDFKGLMCVSNESVAMQQNI